MSAFTRNVAMSASTRNVAMGSFMRTKFNMTWRAKVPERGKTLCAAAAASLLALTGCNQIDPLKRPYMWHESGANQHNIAAMAVNPADLSHGRDTSKRQAITESDGVRRLWSGTQLPLLTSGGSSGGGASGGASGGGSAPPAGGGS